MVQVASGLQHIGVGEFHPQEVGVPDVLDGVASGSVFLSLTDHSCKQFCRYRKYQHIPLKVKI